MYQFDTYKTLGVNRKISFKPFGKKKIDTRIRSKNCIKFWLKTNHIDNFTKNCMIRKLCIIRQSLVKIVSLEKYIIPYD